jgi:hypothetical protein
MSIIDSPRVKSRPEPVWNYELVGERLVEAANVIRRMPMAIYPKRFGNSWPRFEPSQAELQQLMDELQQDGKLEAWQRERNRIHVQPTALEIELAEEAIAWLPRYLGNDTAAAGIVGAWANRTFSYAPMSIFDEGDQVPPQVRAALREISRGLRRDRVPVRRPRR